MIKFFRKIRQKMLTENKFNKYLLYAIGEIFLVVIGILIALQINNWNETRKDREKEDFFLHKLSSNLRDDIVSLHDIIDSDSLMIRDLAKLSNEILTVKSVQEISYDNNSKFKYFMFSPNTSVYDNLISSGQIGLIRNDSVFDKLTNYYKKTAQINKGTDESLKNYSNEIESFYLRFDHRRDDEILPKRDIADYRNEPFLLNSLYYKIGLLKFQINNYTALLIESKTLLKIVELEIEKTIKH